MDGIPRINLGEQLNVEPFANLSEKDARTIAENRWGLRVRAVTTLRTERDDSFYIEATSGDYVLKASHPSDSTGLVDLQTKAMQFAAQVDPRLPLQRAIATTSGELEPRIPEHENRITRLLTWLPGTPLYAARPNDAQLGTLGESLGRLNFALRSFEHPSARRPLAWDLMTVMKLAPLLEVFPSDAVGEALRRYEELVVPRIAELPKQVVHNDFNPGNVIVDASHPDYAVGLLDFGDVVHSARVAELAIGLSYFVFPGHRSQRELDCFIDGFERMVPLTSLERDLLPPLVAARFVQRILINQYLARGNPDDRTDTSFAAQGNIAALAALLEHD